MSAYRLEETGEAPPQPPADPSGLTATALSPTEVELAWAPGSTDETGFEVERSTGGASGPFTLLTTVGAGVTGHLDAGLEALTEYCYRVRAFNDDGPSGYSETACATTPSATAQYTLTVNVVGAGTVAVDPDLPSYEEGQEVTLTATADEGWVFSGWSGALGGTANPATITMVADTEVTAAFDPDPDAEPPPNDVTFVWSGAVTTTGATVNAQLAENTDAIRLVVSEQQDLSTPLYSAIHSVDESTNRVVSIGISGLEPDTQYHYAIEADGVVYDSMMGKFKTFADGPSSFMFAFSNHAQTGSEHGIFNEVRQREPLFFLSTGDWQDDDIVMNDVNLFRQAYDAQVKSTAQSALYRSTPFVYMWDDHDYGPNDSDATSPGREASRRVYQEYVPHYPIASGSGDVPIQQAFSVGRVRFIMTDLRSERTPNSAPDGPDKSMMGAEQKEWFKQELLAANDVYPVIVWVNTVPWIAAEQEGADHWGGFATERREIADFIEQHDIKGLMVLSGDAHALAIDDGSNNTFATSGQPSFPVFQAGAMDSTARSKGGPYSHGDVKGKQQFGLVTVLDDGGSQINISWVGLGLVTGEYRTRVSWNTSIQVPQGTG